MGARRHGLAVVGLSMLLTVLGFFVGVHGEVSLLRGEESLADRLSDQVPPPASANFAGPAPVSAVARRKADADPGVAVLAYHGVSAKPEDRFTVSVERFESHLRALEAAGFVTVSLEEFEDYIVRGRSLPRRSVLLTFDDGLVSQWQVVDPILAKYAMRATVALITGRVGVSPGFVTWPELSAMRANGRWDIAAHSHAGHVRVRVEGGRRQPFLINRRVNDDGVLESRHEFARRVANDLDAQASAFRTAGLATPRTFVYPFSAALAPTNDAEAPAIAEESITRAGFGVSLRTDPKAYWIQSRSRGTEYCPDSVYIEIQRLKTSSHRFFQLNHCESIERLTSLVFRRFGNLSSARLVS